MLAANARKIEAMLDPDAVVLDIGGWGQTFARADHVVDMLPYATRGAYGRIGDGPERFSEATWVVHDVNRSLPYPDDHFDFVVCSHVLEDIRDPITLCAEINRVGRAGYIEVPSRIVETTFGLEGRYAGYYHHRWLVETVDGGVVFRGKPHLLHHSKRFSVPRRVFDGLRDEQRVTWLFWEGSFAFSEIVNVSRQGVERELEAFRSQWVDFTPVAAAREDPRAALASVVRRNPLLSGVARALLRRPLTDSSGVTVWDDQHDLQLDASGEIVDTAVTS